LFITEFKKGDKHIYGGAGSAQVMYCAETRTWNRRCGRVAVPVARLPMGRKGRGLDQ